MIDRLRALWNRPIEEHQRVPLFFLAAGVVVVFAVVLLVTRPDGERAVGPAPTVTSVARPVPVPVVPERTVTQAPPGTPEASAPYASPVAAERAMREFLDGYLAYLYGRGEAGGIERAAAPLVRRLAANPPRVSPAQKERSPKIVEVRARRPHRGRVQLVATIDAGGVSQYPIGAQLVVRDGRWTVTEILNDE